jgi:hypothetical protein
MPRRRQLGMIFLAQPNRHREQKKNTFARISKSEEPFFKNARFTPIQELTKQVESHI